MPSATTTTMVMNPFRLNRRLTFSRRFLRRTRTSCSNSSSEPGTSRLMPRQPLKSVLSKRIEGLVSVASVLPGVLQTVYQTSVPESPRVHQIPWAETANRYHNPCRQALQESVPRPCLPDGRYPNRQQGQLYARTG